MSSGKQHLSFVVRRLPLHPRLDTYLATRIKTRSRTYFQKLIQQGRVQVNDQPAKRHHEVKLDDRIDVVLDLEPRPSRVQPEEKPLDILYEDDTLIVIHKAAGQVVHPAKGHWHGTLISAVLHHCRSDEAVGGPSFAKVVHRIDRDTSGVLLFAKNPATHPAIALQFERRQARKTYLAIVEGTMRSSEGTIDLPLGPHMFQRFKVTVRADAGRPSVTEYEALERFDGFTFLKLSPRTGRGHQIRVHLAAMGHPVLCDRVYGKREALYRADLENDPLATGGEALLARQALHAHTLAIRHPVSGQWMEFTAPLPKDMERTLDALRDLRPWKGDHR